MLEMTRRTVLAGTLAATPPWPLPKERASMQLEDLVACVRHALELTETEAWLVGQRLIWSTGGPSQLLAGVGAALRASAMIRIGTLDARDTLPKRALLALYDGGAPSGVWRAATGSTVELCGVRMAAFTDRGRSACLVQPRKAGKPMEIVLDS